MLEQFKDEINNLENKKSFISYNKYKVDSVNDGYAKMHADIDENSMNPYGIIHGGLIYGLADTCMGVAIATFGNFAVTININMNYLRAGKGSIITCESNVIKKGKNIIFCESNIFDDNSELIATCTGTYNFVQDANIAQ